MRPPTPSGEPGSRAIGAGRWLGLDLGGTHLKAAVLDVGDDGHAETVFTSRRDTAAERGPWRVVADLISTARELDAVHGPFDGVGIGVPGLFDADAGTIEFVPNLPGAWRGVPLVGELAAGLDRPVHIINDARAFTLAEATMGAAEHVRTVAAYVLGTGVGGGLMIDGRLLFGPHGRAGELGHCVVEPDGPVCGCGARGCLEVFAAAPRLAAAAGRPTAEEAFAAAAAGDRRAVEAIDALCDRFARAIVDIVNVLRPDRIVVGGGVAVAGDALFVPLRAAVADRLTLAGPEDFDIVPATLGPWAGVIGAALWAACR